MIRMFFTLLFMLLLFCTCNRKQDYGQFLNQQLKRRYFSYTCNYDTIIIIPREGCNACISEANSFFRKNRNNNSYLFIFTKINSQKELRITFGNEILNAENVLIDKNNSFYIFDEANSNYPLILIKQVDNKFSFDQLNFY